MNEKITDSAEKPSVILRADLFVRERVLFVLFGIAVVIQFIGQIMFITGRWILTGSPIYHLSKIQLRTEEEME